MSRPAGPSSGGYGARAHAGRLAPGGVVGDGRYRLLAQFGEDTRAGAQFWRARDSQLGRDVAMSVLVGDPADTRAAAQARRTLDRATHSATFTHPIVARVIDVLSLGDGITSGEGVLGIVVAEWSPGTDLTDLVADGPVPPGTAAALLEPITAAVEQAHQTGVVLGVDHPQRLRVAQDGALRLAFPGALPEATLRDDVRGLGALLYLLLTARWPLSGGPEALPHAPTGPDGAVVAPRTLVPQVPSELSNLAVRSLADGRNTVGGIRTSAAILAVLERVADDSGGNEQVRRRTAAAGGEEDDPDGYGTVWTTKKPRRDPVRRKRLAIAVGVLGVATVALLVWLVTGVIGFFSESDSSAAPPRFTATQQPPRQPAGRPPAKPAASEPIKPQDVSVFNVSGDPDNPDDLSRVTDGDPETSWSTQEYDENFPALKPGVGVLAEFDRPVSAAQVNIASPSAGTRVEVRTADSADPDLDETQTVGGGSLGGGETQIKLAGYEPSRYLLIWVTSLADDGGSYSSSIGELSVVPAR